MSYVKIVLVVNVIILLQRDYNNGMRSCIIGFNNVLPSSSAPEGPVALSDFLLAEESITSMWSVSPEAIFIFLLHPLFWSLSVIYLHNINSHGSHHTCIAYTMIHYNLIRRNQLVYAKMLARSIRLTRPLIVTGLQIKILIFLRIDNRLKWVDGTVSGTGTICIYEWNQSDR